MHVVDSSVVVKWLIEEEGTKDALRYLGTELVAPDIVAAEVGNVAWKKWRRNEISREQVFIVNGFVASFVQMVPMQPLTEAALGIALELDHPVYDCYFLALAEEMSIPLITFDRRLWKACRGGRFEGRVSCLNEND